MQQACQLVKISSHEAQGLLHKNSREIVTIPKGAVSPMTKYPGVCIVLQKKVRLSIALTE